MDIKKFVESTVPVIAFTVFCASLFFVYFARPPVIFVTDVYFSTLYSAKYERLRRLEASYKLRSAVKIVQVSGDADSLSIVEYIMKFSKRPAAVFFQNAYIEAAETYAGMMVKEGLVSTKIFVLRDRLQMRTPPSEDSTLLFVQDAADIDLYRAGLCSAILAKDTAPETEEDNPRNSIFFVHDMDISDAEKHSFLEGTNSGGFTGRLDFINGYTNRNWAYAAAVILQGTSPAFIQSAPDVPVILFSWFTDINYMPDNVKMVIDDSPYTIIPAALKEAAKAAEGTRILSIPSHFLIFSQRIIHKPLVKELKKAASQSGLSASAP